MRAFSQVDVFSTQPHRGNPVAVVHGAQGLDEAAMAAFARWTNLSETTFLLPPTQPGADYRLRIFTPGAELPFAGHPTLGSAHAWLEAGGRPAQQEYVVQECAAGLVRLLRGETLSFRAPPLLRSGPVSSADRARFVAGLGVDPERVMDLAWIDNGPGWAGLLLDSAETVLGLEPDWVALDGLKIGVLGPWAADPAGPAGPGSGEHGAAAVEVRAFCPGLGMNEDPVTGSLNAGLAQWLIGAGVLPQRYTASQGTALGRAGRVHVEQRDGEVWIGGATTTVVRGEVAFPGH